MTLLSILAYVVAYGALAFVVVGAVGIFVVVIARSVAFGVVEWQRHDELAARERRPWNR